MTIRPPTQHHPAVRPLAWVEELLDLNLGGWYAGVGRWLRQASKATTPPDTTPATK